MAMVPAKSKELLVQQLAVLLGFGEDDGAADDMLEHLLTIESSKDLLDYLTQLLGADKIEAMRSFVDNVGRFQRGEAIISVEKEDAEVKSEEKTAVAPLESEKQKSPAKLSTLPRKTAPPRKKEAPSLPQKQSALPKQVPSEAPKVPQKNEAPLKESLPAENSAEEVKPPPKRGPPPRGKAKVVCGCFGNMHRALTNCLYCGRISCEREGYDFCPFCGVLVEEVKSVRPGGSVSSADAAAWKHKERLLRYDREFAQRTVILDDQVDYYRNQTSTWLTDEEKADAAAKEEERQDQVHKRKQMELNLAL
jgi:hypothetical protein